MLNLSIGIVALNEKKYLPNLLNDLVNQTYEHLNIEVLLIDSGSDDGTKEIMLDFKKKNPGSFQRIVVLDNPKKTQAAGWNVAIDNFSGDALTRIDAHSKIDKDFCKYVVENLECGEFVVGGKRPCLIEKETQWAMTLLQVENSLFGSSFLKSRSSNKKQYVKTMFHATYRREVFEKVGHFNELLLRTEDNEFHYRIAKAGYKLCYDPRILSFQYARGSFKKMMKQKYDNGYWIGKTVKKYPGCISAYHFAPLTFVVLILVCIALIPFHFYYPLVILLSLHLAFSIINTITSSLSNGFSFSRLLMPFLFFALHICYGIGTGFGLLDCRKL